LGIDHLWRESETRIKAIPITGVERKPRSEWAPRTSATDWQRGRFWSCQRDATMKVVQLDAAKLDHPELDIRYGRPDLLVSRAGGLLSEGGYDYAEDGPGTTLLFLETDRPMRLCRVATRSRAFSHSMRAAQFPSDQSSASPRGARRDAEGSCMLAIRLRPAWLEAKQIEVD
jgi:hypothetical protein